MSNIDFFVKCFFIITLLNSQPVKAALDIEVAGAGERQIPIAIVQFAGENKLSQSITNIVGADLQRSGQFRLIDPTNKSPHEINDVDYSAWSDTDALIIGKVDVKANGRIMVKIQLLDTVLKTELIKTVVTGNDSEIRTIAHRIADLIFEKITGDAGIFDTRISYINRQTEGYKLIVTDSDGYNEKVIFSSNTTIMSPAWSPDGSHLAFVAFENDEAVVYVQSMLTNQRIVAAHFPENNTAPVWSPDGQRLAFVISNDGSSHIFLIRLDGSNLEQLTFDDEIDSEPNFSPDGQSLIFESDRSGKVQIYKISLFDGNVERLTFEGSNNYSPHYSPDGKSFVYSSWIEGKFFIATEDIQTKQVQLLTDGGWEENPSFSPNGKMILFATEINGRSNLATVSIDGKVKQTLLAQSGNIMDPSWGPLIRH